MMNARRIVSPSDPMLPGCIRIYEDSFPYAERRSTEELVSMLQDDRLHFIVFSGECWEDGPLGFFTFWDFGHGYLYGEHFAVTPACRGGGIGTRVLDYIKSMEIPMILEIETPSDEDETTLRRRLFYERNGFILNPHEHVQPAYHSDSEPVPMKVMTWPYVFSPEEYEQFRTDQLGIMPAL